MTAGMGRWIAGVPVLAALLAGSGAPPPVARDRIATEALLAPARPTVLAAPLRDRILTILQARARAFGEGKASVTAAEGGFRVVARGEYRRRPFALLGSTGQFEIRWLRAVDSGRRPRGRYLIQIGEGSGILRYTFAEARTGRPVATADVLAASPLLADRRSLRPGSALEIVSSSRLAVRVEFTEEATTRLRRFAAEHRPTLVAIVLDGEILVIQPVTEEIPKEVKAAEMLIMGGYRDEVEARVLAAVINSEPLPLPLSVQEARYLPLEPSGDDR